MFDLDKIERGLLRTKKTLRQVCNELDIDVPEDRELITTEQCTNCSIWHYKFKLIEDEDGNEICKVCWEFYGA